MTNGVKRSLGQKTRLFLGHCCFCGLLGKYTRGREPLSRALRARGSGPHCPPWTQQLLGSPPGTSPDLQPRQSPRDTRWWLAVWPVCLARRNLKTRKSLQAEVSQVQLGTVSVGFRREFKQPLFAAWSWPCVDPVRGPESGPAGHLLACKPSFGFGAYPRTWASSCPLAFCEARLLCAA